jgi:DNA ligase (NAD+)
VIGPVAAKRPALSAEFNMLAKTGGVCPECESAIHKPEGEVMYYCSNASCPAQAMLKIEHFASRPAMDIRGIGEKMSVLLFKEGLVSNFADLYALKAKRAQLLAIERMAEKSVDNLLKAIEKSKTRPLPNLIFAMGIRHVGEETSHILAETFRNIAAIAESTAEQLEEIPAIGPKIADSIVTYFSNPQNKKIIEKLGESGVSMRFESKAKGERPLEGKEFVITGKLSSMPRPFAEEKIKQLGGTAKGDPTRKTDFLVLGEDPGSKLERAEKMNIKIINESEFLGLLE